MGSQSSDGVSPVEHGVDWRVHMGWQIRLGNGEDVTPLTLGETIREAHPKIIGGAFFFFLLGGLRPDLTVAVKNVGSGKS